MSRRLAIATLLLAAAVVVGACGSSQSPAGAGGRLEARVPAQATAPAGDRVPASLPAEALATLQVIERGGPFPYDRDGSTFQNREGRLPERPRGYYREYTVPTPGASNRGARRIVAGGDPPEVYYYTDDHYRTFRRVDPAQ